MSNLIKNTSIYTLGNFIPKALAIFLLPVYTHYLSPAEYGIIGSMQSIMPILVVLFTLGFDASIFRLYWDYDTEKDRREFFGTMFLSKLIISSLILFAIFLSKDVISKTFPSISFYPYYFYLIVTVFLSSFFELPKKYFMLKEKPILYVAFNLVIFSIKTVLILWLIIFTSEGAEGYLKALMLSSIVVFPVAIYITLKFAKLKLSLSKLKNIINFSLPIIPTLLFAWVLDLSDRIFIERYYSMKEIGIYSIAYQIASIIIVLIVSFHNTYRPLFFKLANNVNNKNAQNTIGRYNNVFILGIGFVIFIVSLFSNEIINIFFKEEYLDAAKIIPLILIAHFFNGMQGLIGRYIEQSKKMKISMYIAFIASVLNIILNFLLIPKYGMQGAAYATIISFASSFLLRYLYARKHTFFVSFTWITILPLIIAMVTIVFLFQFLFVFENIYLAILVKMLFISIITFYLFKKYHSLIKILFKKSISN